MGYVCPICEVPQQNETHLANHIAFAAMLGNENHEEWLDEYVPEWEEMGPERLGERVSTFAPEQEFETVFEDTTPHSYDHPTQFEESLPRQRGRQAIDGETSSVLAEAEAMTREMYETEEE